jgi:hypothetical protein
MSSETDQPRQRTVAELLAEYGEGPSATGRRRSRRPAEAEANGGRTRDQAASPASSSRSAAPPARAERPPAPPSRPPRDLRGPDLLREDPTDVFPRIPAEPPPREERSKATGRMPPPANGRDRATAEDSGPSTMVGGAPLEAERWHRERVSGSGRPLAPVEAARPADLDDLDDLDDDLDDDFASELDDDLDEDLDHDLDDELDDVDDLDAEEDEDAAAEPAGGRTRGAAWAAVVAQWIAGAIGGAGLWVGFRFLWQDFPVVAIAAAVLVTAALVVVVRALLRNNDLRTTIFAVLVGLLLTVSPAVLVFIDR